MNDTPIQISPTELKTLLDQKKSFILLDVREPEEWKIANIGGILIPLHEITQRYEELDPQSEIVVLCHHGIRSAQATAFLRSQGYHRARNLSGGIDRWSCEVDPKIPRY